MKPFAFVFPGQGSQSVGMLDSWGDHPVVAQTLEEAGQALGEDIALEVEQAEDVPPLEADAAMLEARAKG